MSTSNPITSNESFQVLHELLGLDDLLSLYVY